MTKEYKQYLFVEVKIGAMNFGAFENNQFDYSYRDKQGYLHYTSTGILPPGSYSIVGLANELTEEQWSEVVEADGSPWPGYKDYSYPNDVAFSSARQSGYSLLSHLGLSKNPLIIKKEEK